MRHEITKIARRNMRITARLRRIQGQIFSLARCLATEPDLINLIQRAAAARGAMNGLVSDQMEERLLSLQALATSDETHAESAEMIDIVDGYLN